MPAPHLRVTVRCLKDDLGLPDVLAKRDARNYKERHDAVRKFVDQRSVAPSGGEVIKSLPPLGKFRSVHVGRPRAVSIWDEENDVCWLVGYEEYHAAGDIKDSYEVFAALHRRHELVPTADDYENLFEITSESLIESLRGYADGMIQKARQRPGQEVEQTFVATADAALGTAMLTVDLVCEVDGALEEGWVGLLLPENTLWPKGGALALARALVPPQVSSDSIIPTNVVGDRRTYPNELAFTWTLDVSGLI